MLSSYELPSECVYCAPLPSGETAIFLPILPENIRYSSESYREFLETFSEIVFYDRDSHSGFIQVVLDSGVFYRANILRAFLDILQSQGSAVVVPYCFTEGLPLRDIYGVVLETREDSMPPRAQEDIV